MPKKLPRIPLKLLRRPQKTQEFPLVEVVWEDAVLDPGAVGQLSDKEPFGKMMECRDIGYLVEITRKEVILCTSISDDDGQFRHSNTLPRKWTKEIILLARQGV